MIGQNVDQLIFIFRFKERLYGARWRNSGRFNFLWRLPYKT